MLFYLHISICFLQKEKKIFFNEDTFMRLNEKTHNSKKLIHAQGQRLGHWNSLNKVDSVPARTTWESQDD